MSRMSLLVAVAATLACSTVTKSSASTPVLDAGPAPEPTTDAWSATSVAIDRERGCVTTEARELLCWGDGTPVTAELTLCARDVDPIVKLEGPCLLERDGELRCDRFESRGWFEPVSATLRQRTGVRDFAFGLDTEPTLCVLDDRGLECFDAKSGAAISMAEIQAPSTLEFEGDALCVIHDHGALACQYVDADQIVPLAWTDDFVAFAQGRSPNSLCALDAQGWPVCWWASFEDYDHSLEYSTPERVAALPAAVELAQTDSEICVRTAEGRVGCRELDPYDTDTRVEWFDIDNVVELAAGTDLLCMRDQAGAVICVGHDREGLMTIPRHRYR